MTRLDAPDLSKVTVYFDASGVSAYRISDLAALQLEYSEAWNVPAKMGTETFRKWLIEKTKLIEVKLKSHSYPSLTRYTWGQTVPAVAIALSIKRPSYCSHGTALWIHGLGGKANEIFVNAEQSEKSFDLPVLRQEAIHRAFRSRQRMSNLIYSAKKARITVLSGKQTGNLEVYPARTPLGDLVDVTSMERTLIDATVRPSYVHGTAAVLQAFRSARGKISVRKLCDVLQKLDYTYPYHQAIGFYLQRAGYPFADYQMLAKFGKQFEFYLCHGLKNPAFDPEWRLFFPNELSSP